MKSGVLLTPDGLLFLFLNVGIFIYNGKESETENVRDRVNGGAYRIGVHAYMYVCVCVIERKCTRPKTISM